MYTLEDIQAVDMEVADAITKEFDRQNIWHYTEILSAPCRLYATSAVDGQYSDPVKATECTSIQFRNRPINLL